MRLSGFETLEGAPILPRTVRYRGEKPVTVNVVISRYCGSVWYLGTSFGDAKQTVAWYRKRFWIEEMFRDLKSRLGLRRAYLKEENRLAALLLGYMITYLTGTGRQDYTGDWGCRIKDTQQGGMLPELDVFWPLEAVGPQKVRNKGDEGRHP
jgi:hypothetical protein